MKSMTGFGRGATTGDNFSVSIDLKTVNNRFLDINMRLPSELQELEAETKRAISLRLSRGRVDVNLQYEQSGEIAYEVNRPMITGFLAAMQEMQGEFSLGGEADVNVIARLPNVLVPKKHDFTEAFTHGVASALAAALDDLEQMRKAEGEMLRNEISSRLDSIERLLLPVEADAGSVAEEYRQRLTKRIGDMLSKSESQVEIDQGRLAQEIAYLADRADISEEIARLRTHIEHFRNIMSEESEVGKRLDFLTQELNREANTITSKSGNVAIKESALAIKSDIEKIREQIQNVE
ncbi:MAG: YicC/YloC family endoribonuclease [Pyrinomonadaceae bacterium]